MLHYPYSNNPDGVDILWYELKTTPEGKVPGNHHAENLAKHLQHRLDDGSLRAAEEGDRVNHEDVNPAAREVKVKQLGAVE